MDAISRTFKWLITVPEGPRTAGHVIVWWEQRRLPYNIIIGVLGTVSLLLFYFFILSCDVLRPGEDAVEPLALLITPFLVNIAYTAGWIVEILCKPLIPKHNEKMIGPALLVLGFSFSIIVVSLPSLFWGISWFAHLVSQ